MIELIDRDRLSETIVLLLFCFNNNFGGHRTCFTDDCILGMNDLRNNQFGINSFISPSEWMVGWRDNTSLRYSFLVGSCLGDTYI